MLGVLYWFPVARHKEASPVLGTEARVRGWPGRGSEAGYCGRGVGAGRTRKLKYGTWGCNVLYLFLTCLTARSVPLGPLSRQHRLLDPSLLDMLSRRKRSLRGQRGLQARSRGAGGSTSWDPWGLAPGRALPLHGADHGTCRLIAGRFSSECFIWNCNADESDTFLFNFLFMLFFFL